MARTALDRARGAPLLAAVIAFALLTSCAAGESPAPPEPRSPPPEANGSVTTVAEGLDAPWSITFYGQTPLLSERDSARILELGAGGEHREVAVIPDVEPGGEGGLLGIAAHEEYLFVYFTSREDNRIVRYPIRGEPGALVLGEREMILSGIPAASTHNGGRLAIGPDDTLYATTGDAGNTASAQELQNLAGKILRLAPDGTIPAENPFEDSPVYSYGHRNPQGIAWGSDGAMYASEFGQDTWDELNIIEAGGNYGWPEVEGIAGEGEYIDPVQQWRPADASPSGIAIAGDSLYLANLRGERLREVPLGDLTDATVQMDDRGRLRDVTVAPDGSLWVLTNNTDGRGSPAPGDDRILKIIPDP